MKKKLLFIISFIFLLTGCSTEYNLSISNDGIKEHTVVTIPDSAIPKKDSNGQVDDRVTPFIADDQYPFFGNEETIYKKKVTKKNGNTIVTLDYNFTHDNFKESYVYKGCFSNSEYEKDKNGYSLHLYGNFYCMHGNKVTIKIKTNNRVLEHNADKVSGNVYTWVIDSDNMLDTNIKIKLSKELWITRYIGYAIVIILLVGVSIGGYKVYRRFVNSRDVNEI